MLPVGVLLPIIMALKSYVPNFIPPVLFVLELSCSESYTQTGLPVDGIRLRNVIQNLTQIYNFLDKSIHQFCHVFSVCDKHWFSRISTLYSFMSQKKTFFGEKCACVCKQEKSKTSERDDIWFKVFKLKMYIFANFWAKFVKPMSVHVSVFVFRTG